MRSMWKGTVSFGLVSIPIHLYAATEGKSITFRQVHAADGGRVQYKRVCSVDGAEVPYAEIAKGYQLDDGSMVVLTDEDLATVPVSTSQAIDVLEFLPLEAIDPIAYDRSYYLEPQKAAVKPYVLLRDALAKSGRVALVKVTLRQRESLALLRVYADVLVLSTLLWPEEVRTPKFAFLDEQPQIRDQELAMAGSLIESMAEDVFDPDGYQDSYQQALADLIDAKIAGREVSAPPHTGDGDAQVIDLMSALQASIGATKSRGDTEDAAHAPGTGDTTDTQDTASEGAADDTELDGDRPTDSPRRATPGKSAKSRAGKTSASKATPKSAKTTPKAQSAAAKTAGTKSPDTSTAQSTASKHAAKARGDQSGSSKDAGSKAAGSKTGSKTAPGTTRGAKTGTGHTATSSSVKSAQGANSDSTAKGSRRRSKSA